MMNKQVKIWLIAAACLIVLGCILWVGVMMNLHWDFTKLSTVKMESNSYTVTQPYQNISIQATTADISVLPSEDAQCKVVCNDQSEIKHEVSVDGDTLTFQVKDTRKWYQHIGIGFESSKITVYLPAGEYGALTISSTTGDISLEGVSADTVQVKLSTGDIKLTDIACRSVSVTGTTGDTVLENVVAKEKLSAERNTGDILLKDCDGGEITLKTTTGDVTGTLLTSKSFVAKTSTGDIDIPQNTDGGRCAVTTTTGDIRLRIQK